RAIYLGGQHLVTDQQALDDEVIEKMR
ncbi:hypothetical protein Q6315_29010, partial [Klebsiella pneumoniae]